MNIVKFAKRFAKEELGLVTVEWVSVAAAVVIGGIFIATLVLKGMETPASNIGTALSSVPGTVSAPTYP